jgi:hypothetical protein
MTNITITLDDDQIDDIVAKALKEHYSLCKMNSAYYDPNLIPALEVVLSEYLSPNDYNNFMKALK